MPELDRYLAEFSKAIQETPKGALKIIQWIGGRETGVRNLILKTPQGPVRTVSMKIFLMALAKIQDFSRDQTLSEAEQGKWKLRYTECVREVVATLEKLWPILHTASRAWDDYFEFLTLLTTFPIPKIDIILDYGFLLKCLEIIWLDREDSKRLKRQYALYYRNIERGRKYSHRKLFEFLASLMKNIDFTLLPTADDGPRTVHGGRFSLNETESSFIWPLGRNKELVFVRKILQQHSNPSACRVIVGYLLDAEPDSGLLEPIIKVLEDGLRVAPAALCAPFLEATLTFCKRSPDEEQIVALIDYVAKGVESINNSGGKEHLGFFTNVFTYRNERLQKDEIWFESLVVERVPDWAPTLLIYADKTVRNLTFDLLRELLFNKEQEEQSDEARIFYAKIAKDLTQMCVEQLRKTYLVAPGQNIEAKLIENINIVINHCLEAYYDEGEEDDAEFMQQAAGKLIAHPVSG
jgi:ubiquitin carboxyl-terminal hydrolase 34